MLLSAVFCEAQILSVVERPKEICINGVSLDYAKNHVYKVGDSYIQVPYYPNLSDYLVKNFVYPMVCEENGIQGDVYISFFVEQDGNINNVKLDKSVDPLLDKEALRLVNGMRKWIPGKNGEEIVRTKYTIRIGFHLR